jgi:hypothetical protein
LVDFFAAHVPATWATAYSKLSHPQRRLATALRERLCSADDVGRQEITVRNKLRSRPV